MPVSEKTLSLKISTALLNAFWRALYPFNAFLILVLFVQSAVFTMLYFEGYVRLPDFICEIVRNEISKCGIDAEFSSISVSLRGELRADSPSLRFSGTPQAFFMARRIYVDVSPWGVLSGNFHLRSASVYDGRFSTSFGDINSNPAIKGFFLSVAREGKWWILNAARLRIGELSVGCDGRVASDFDYRELTYDLCIPENLGGALKSKDSVSEKSGRLEPLDAAGKLDKILTAALDAVGHLDGFAEPAIDINMLFCGGGKNSARINFVSGEIDGDVYGYQCSVKNAEVRLAYSGDEPIHRRLSILLQAKEISGWEVSACENLTARAFFLPDYESPALDSLALNAAKIKYKNFSLDNVSLEKHVLDMENWRNDWYIFAAFGVNRLGGMLEFPAQKSLKFDFIANVNPMEIINVGEFEDIRELKQMSFNRGIGIYGMLKYDFSSNKANADLSFESDDCVVMNIPVAHLSGDFYYDGDANSFFADNLDVESQAGWKVEGNMFQSLENRDYSICVKGNIRPSDIAHFMEPWWTKTVCAFTFKNPNSNFPNADVVVKGRWGSPQYIWCYGSANGQEASYNGVDFSDFSLNIWVNPSRISLYDVSVNAGDRQAHCFIEWLYGDGGLTRYLNQRLFLESTLSADELALLGGKDAKDVLDVLKFGSPPRLTMNAIFRNPRNNPENLADAIEVDAFCVGQTRVECAVLENLSFSAESDTVNTRVTHADFGFCGGLAEGTLKLKRAANGMDFSGEVSASKMDKNSFSAFLKEISGNGDDKDEPEAEDDEAIVDVVLSLSGNSENFERVSGSGYASLQDSDFIKLNIFGMLSRALSALKLPIGSFDIDYANGSFTISDGEVKFSRLELGGPVMKINGVAEYNFIKDDISAALSARPFGGLTTPLISNIASLINPIANTITIKVKGTLENPDIGVSINPINMLQGREKILDNMEESL